MTAIGRLARTVGLVRREALPFGCRWDDDLVALGHVPAVVFDVGANIGQTVRSVHARFPEAVVHAFEPVPSTYRTLVDSVGGRPSVRTVQAALSDHDGVAEMTDEPLSELNTLLTASRPDQATVTVPMRTLDSYAEERGVGRISLLKIDTEGHELAVLRGAQEALRAGTIDFILAECDFTERPGMPHTPFCDLLAHLHPLGYRVVTFYSHGVDDEGWIWGDVLFMRAGATTRSRSTSFRPWPAFDLPRRRQRAPAAATAAPRSPRG